MGTSKKAPTTDPDINPGPPTIALVKGKIEFSIAKAGIPTTW